MSNLQDCISIGIALRAAKFALEDSRTEKAIMAAEKQLDKALKHQFDLEARLEKSESYIKPWPYSADSLPMNGDTSGTPW